MLRIQSLSHRYENENLVIDNLSLEANKGEIISILGPSGCGKTSLLRIVAGLEKPLKGEIKIDEKIVFNQTINISPEKRNLGLVVEDKALFPHLSVYKNIIFGIRKNKQQKQLAEEFLNLFKIEHLKDKFPHEISSGEQQRTALARAIITNPDILLLDEPFSALDKELKNELHEETKKIFIEKNLTVLLVTHDENESSFFSNRVFKFKDQKLLEI
mgnify:FL=1